MFFGLCTCIIDNVLLDSGAFRPKGLLFTPVAHLRIFLVIIAESLCKLCEVFLFRRQSDAIRGNVRFAVKS